MKALISPNENFRIAQVSPESFEVAAPLFWVECPEDCLADQWTYVDGNFVPPPPPPEPEPTPLES